jgi:hypothetical protein
MSYITNIFREYPIVTTVVIVLFVLILTGSLVHSQLAKNVIFFLIAFFLFVGMAEFAKYLNNNYSIPSHFKTECPNYVFIAISAVVYISIILSLFYILGIKEGYENICSGTRMLQISPAHKCALGPYTWGSPDSEVYKYCSDPKNFQNIAAVNCDRPGFYGQPVNWSYTPESNSKWENERCNCLKSGQQCNCNNPQYDSIAVL